MGCTTSYRLPHGPQLTTQQPPSRLIDSDKAPLVTFDRLRVKFVWGGLHTQSSYSGQVSTVQQLVKALGDGSRNWRPDASSRFGSKPDTHAFLPKTKKPAD